MSSAFLAQRVPRQAHAHLYSSTGRLTPTKPPTSTEPQPASLKNGPHSRNTDLCASFTKLNLSSQPTRIYASAVGTGAKYSGKAMNMSNRARSMLGVAGVKQCSKRRSNIVNLKASNVHDEKEYSDEEDEDCELIPKWTKFYSQVTTGANGRSIRFVRRQLASDIRTAPFRRQNRPEPEIGDVAFSYLDGLAPPGMSIYVMFFDLNKRKLNCFECNYTTTKSRDLNDAIRHQRFHHHHHRVNHH